MQYENYSTTIHGEMLIVLCPSRNINWVENIGIPNGIIFSFLRKGETYQILIHFHEGEVKKFIMRFRGENILKKIWLDRDNKLHNLEGYPAKISYHKNDYAFSYYTHGTFINKKGYNPKEGNYIKHPDGSIEGHIYS